jgi:hypothetical protein
MSSFPAFMSALFGTQFGLAVPRSSVAVSGVVFSLLLLAACASPERTHQRDMLDLLSGSSGSVVALVWKDLDSGSEILLNADVEMHAAGTMKVPVLIEVYRQAELGLLHLDETLPVTATFPSIVPGVGTFTPEAQEGGPIALVRDGDRILIDAIENRIDVQVPEAELRARRAAWKAPALKATRGTLYKYIKNVKNASEGCVTDE